MVNQTIEHQLNHRSIRKFKAENLSDEQIKTLLEVARQTSTSNFFQQFSVLHITDETKREQIRHISKQPYVGLNGELFIFIANHLSLLRIYIVINKFACKKGKMMVACIPRMSFSKRCKMRL